MNERHYGLDWLRIGAFALLILYHTGMFFVEWPWHIKTPQPVGWIEAPMRLVNPWRMSLLFIVSGYATRLLLAKSASPGAFLAERSRRLALPLLFGMAVIVAPQPWVQLGVQHGYAAGFWHFWSHDYFRFGVLDGLLLPTWNHLWFLGYLLLYSLATAAAARLPLPPLQPLFDRALAGWRLWLLPVLACYALRLWDGEEKHDLVTLYDHAVYLPAYVFGLGLAGSPATLAACARHWRPALLLGLLAWAGRIAFNSLTEGMAEADFAPGVLAAVKLLRPLQHWLMLTGLIGLASRHWNHDHRWRAPLNRAVFPAYIVHQTAIVLLAFWLLPLGWSNAAMAAVILPGTVLACALAAALAPRLGPAGVLLGAAPARAGAPPPAIVSSGA